MIIIIMLLLWDVVMAVSPVMLLCVRASGCVVLGVMGVCVVVVVVLYCCNVVVVSHVV